MKALLDVEKQNLLFTSFGGFFLILLGVFATFSPFISGIAVTEIIALIVAAGGMTMFLATFYVPGAKKKIMTFILALISMLTGAAMFFLPLMSMYTLTGVAIAYFIVDGGFTSYAAIKQRREKGWGWMLVSGVMSFILAGMLIYEWPASGLYAVGMLVGVRLIFSGWTMMMLGVAANSVISQVKENFRSADNEEIVNSEEASVKA